MTDENVTQETTETSGLTADDLKSALAAQVEAEHEKPGEAIYNSDVQRDELPDLDFKVAGSDEDAAVATKVGTLGWPAGAENEQGVGPDGQKVDDES